MNTKNKITFLMAGIFSIFWFYVIPEEERFVVTVMKSDEVFLSYSQLFFIFLGIIVLITQKLNINSLYKAYKKYKQMDKQIDRQIDNTTVILLYILSFFIPLAGFIVGAIYASKDEEHYKHVGKNCLIFSVMNIILGFIMIVAILGSV